VARRHRCASGAAVQVLDHVPDRALCARDPRRLRVLRDLSHIEHQQLIDELFDYDDPAGSEARFRAAAEAAPEPTRSVLLTQVARALGLQGKYDEATDLLASLSLDDPEVEVRGLLERGRILNTRGDADTAMVLFAQAVGLAGNGRFEFLMVDAVHMSAIVAPPSEQDELNRQALRLASAASDPRARQWRASLLNNMGWTAFERGAYSDALSLFDDALAARVEQGKPQEIQVARWCVARTLRALGRVDEALAIQRALAEEHRLAGTADQYVDEEIEALTRESGENNA
jgi:tetratricopeptide (TPR) repeat protein